MNKGLIAVIVGLILVMAAVAIFAIVINEISPGTRTIHLGAGETKNMSMEFKGENIILVINPSGRIHYVFGNTSGKMREENISSQETVNLGKLYGTYTLKIRNLENKTQDVTVVTMSEENMLSVGYKTLVSGAVCLIGIIVIIVGAVLAIRGRRRNVY